MNLEEALSKLKEDPLMSFATSVDGQPYVRIMALVNHNDKFYCVTSKSRPKTQQIQTNPKFSFVVKLAGDKDIGSVRARGLTEIISDSNLKKEIGSSITWFKNFWKTYEDPEFVLVRLHINQILIHDPNSKERVGFDNLNL